MRIDGHMHLKNDLCLPGNASIPGHIAWFPSCLPPQHPVVRNALFCLELAWRSAKEGAHGKHVYTKALLAYAFALAGNQDKRIETLNLLHEEAVKEGESTSEIFSYPPFSVSRTVLQNPHTYIL